MNLPPPGVAAYTFCTRPGIARFTIDRIDASVGMPAMDTCSSDGPITVCMMGFFRVVTHFTLITGTCLGATPV